MRRALRTAISLSAALALLLGCGSPADEAEAPSEPNAAVTTASVSRGAVEEALHALGSVELDPDRMHSLVLDRAGEVRRVAVVPGQRVAKNELLLVLGPVPKATLETRQAGIDLDFAERELARVQRLREAKLATNAELDAAAKQLATNRAVLQALGADGTGSTQELRADEDSVVVEVRVTAGSRVKAGESVLVLAPRGGLVVRAAFAPEEAAGMSPGLPVRLEPVFGGSQEVHAKLTRLHALVDPATQRVEAWIRVPEPPDWMSAGGSLHVRVVVRASENALLVPREALLERDGATGVFVIADGRAHWRPIAPGIAGEAIVEATQGVAAGDRVAVAGRTTLEDGMRVRVEAPPAAQ